MPDFHRLVPSHSVVGPIDMNWQLKMRRSRPAHFDAWVAYFDVYGFSALLDKRGEADIHEQLVALHQQGEKIMSLKNRKYLSFSDSIFVVVPVPTPEERGILLIDLMEKVQDLMTIFFEADLALRGAISFGPISYSPGMLVGTPIVRAVRTEKALSFPLVFVPARELHGENRTIISNFQESRFYNMANIPVRPAGVMHGALIFPSSIKAFSMEAQKKFEEYAIYGPPEVAQAWQTTLRFVRSNIERMEDRK